MHQKNLFWLLLLILGSYPNLYSQTQYKRKISVAEWVDEMVNHQDTVYILRDTEIYFDPRKDTAYSWEQPRSPKADTIPKKTIEIKPMVILQNCQLPNNATVNINYLNFLRNITFRSCSGSSQMIFYACTFRSGIDFLVSDFGSMGFLYSEILQRIIISELQINDFTIANCTLSTDQRDPPHFNNYGFEVENKDYQFLLRLYQNQRKINEFVFAYNQILPTSVKPVILFNGGKYDKISFGEMDFLNTIIDFSNCSVKEYFTFQNCQINHPFGAYNFNIPLNNTAFHWSQLDSLGLGIYGDYEEEPLTFQSDSLFTDRHWYNSLRSSYQKFFTTYKTQGDSESANACYIQIKDMETGKYRYQYRQDVQLNTWFNWRFNQFLRYFSEYGTNPIQSLIVSMWTILFFAAIYFFFPSDWDKINRHFLIEQHRKIIRYFQSEQRLEDFYTDQHKEGFKAFDTYRDELKQGKGQLPGFILLLGKPLYLLSMIKHRSLILMYRQMEVLKGRWVDLKPLRKGYIAIITVLFIFIYGLYLIFIRAVNSIALSINVFSTLGFGAIPVKGGTRYITIIEGFLGWFLLSIFSVSLIGQMLQY